MLHCLFSFCVMVIYDQKTPNLNKIDTKGSLTDFGRIFNPKWHTKSLPKSDIRKGVVFKMASKMSVNILHWLYLNNYSILKGGVLRCWAQQSKLVTKITNG